MPVSVVIQECAAGAPVRSLDSQAAFLGDVSKGAISVVVVKDVVAPISNEEVVVAVVVVVANANALPPPGMNQAGVPRDVGEGAVSAVVQQSVRMKFGVVRIQPGSIHEKYVDPSVAVGVDERGAAASGLENVAVVNHPAVNCGFSKSSFGRNILEADREISRSVGAMRKRPSQCGETAKRKTATQKPASSHRRFERAHNSPG